MSNAQQTGEELMEKILKGFIDNGKLMIIALGGHGKTVATMHLTKMLQDSIEFDEGIFNIKISDSANVWKWKYSKIPYVDVTKSRMIPDDEQILLIDLGYTDVQMNTNILESIIRTDYYKQRALMDALQGRITLRRIYIIEEMQNIFGTHSINGRSGGFWLKEVSEGRNYGQYMIGLGQRFADISTKVVERTKYFLLGTVSGDNDIKKIKSMFGTHGKSVVDTIMGLKKGNFLWVDRENPSEGSHVVTFPDWKADSFPYEWTPKPVERIEARRVFL
jgi:hypothetical protein